MSELDYGRYLHHYETDSDGVCHFSNYFRVFEEAFFDALRQIMNPDFKPSSLDHSFAVTVAHSTYHRPIKYGDFFNVKFLFSKVGGSYLIGSATFYVGDELCAGVNGKIVSVSKYDGKSTSLDLNLRNTLKNYMKDEAI